MIEIEYGSPVWRELAHATSATAWQDEYRPSKVTLEVHGADTVAIKIGEGMWTAPLSARRTIAHPECRYCERYGNACGRTHTDDTWADWARNWAGEAR